MNKSFAAVPWRVVPIAPCDSSKRPTASHLKPSDVFRLVHGLVGDGSEAFDEAGDTLFFAVAQVEVDVFAQIGGAQPGVELVTCGDDFVELGQPVPLGLQELLPKAGRTLIAANRPDGEDKRQAGVLAPCLAKVEDFVFARIWSDFDVTLPGGSI
mgnify:CR=1 FL=1